MQHPEKFTENERNNYLLQRKVFLHVLHICQLFLQKLLQMKCVTASTNLSNI